MPKNVKRGQAQHDRKVDQVAASARARGRRSVRADLPGQTRPPKIGGRIPDVTWQRPGGGLAIREIDPPGGISAADRKQHQALKRYAQKHPGTNYRRLKY